MDEGQIEVNPALAGQRNAANPYDFKGVAAKPPPSSYNNRNAVGSRRGTAQRLGTGQ